MVYPIIYRVSTILLVVQDFFHPQYVMISKFSIGDCYDMYSNMYYGLVMTNSLRT